MREEFGVIATGVGGDEEDKLDDDVYKSRIPMSFSYLKRSFLLVRDYRLVVEHVICICKCGQLLYRDR